MNYIVWLKFIGIILIECLLAIFFGRSSDNSARAITLFVFIMLATVYIVWAKNKGRLNDVKESRIIRYIAKKWRFVLAFAIYSLIILCISYPGFWYSDSFGRVFLSKQIDGLLWARLWGVGKTTHFSLSTGMSVIMAICIAFTGRIGTYTWVQCFMLISGIAVFLDLFIRNKIAKIFWCTALLICPLIYCNASFYEAGVGCATGIIFLIIIVTKYQGNNTFDRYLCFLSVLFWSYIVFSYRLNAFTIVPVLLLYVFKLYRKDKEELLELTFGLLIGFLLVFGVNRLLKIHIDMSSSEGFIWEVVTSIQNMETEDQENYLHYFDDIVGSNETRGLIEINDPDGIWQMLKMGNVDVRNALQSDGMKSVAMKKYVKFAMEEPRAFWTNKIDMILKVMGVKGNLSIWAWQYKADFKLWEDDMYVIKDNFMRRLYYESNVVFTQGNWLLKPWIMFVCGLILLIVARIKKLDDVSMRIVTVTYWTAVFYYGAFWINTQSYDFRYFFPACILLILCDSVIISELLNKWIMKFKVTRI